MSGQNPVTLSADGIAASVRAANAERSKKDLPPLHLWDPPFCGNLDIRIARDGTWLYLGTPINRFELVRLFSSVLRKEGDGYFLVTPVEKVGITVDDAPFVAVDFEVNGEGAGQSLTFITHVGDSAMAGSDNPIRVEKDPATGEPSPYVHIRNGLEALIDRKSFYRLVELGTDQDGWFGIWSGGQFFPFLSSGEMQAV